jgi:hypothetical protein
MEMGTDFTNCEFAGWGGPAVDIDGGGGDTFTNCVMVGELQINNSFGNKYHGLQVISQSKPMRAIKMGRNELCYCGSQLKYKRCHGGLGVAKGIVSKNSSSVFIDTEINTDGVALDLDGDESTFNRLKIYAFSDPELFKFVKSSGLPGNTPGEYVQEAYTELKKTGDVNVLEESKLKTWLFKQGVTLAFWTQLVAQLAAMAQAA